MAVRWTREQRAWNAPARCCSTRRNRGLSSARFRRRLARGHGKLRGISPASAIFAGFDQLKEELFLPVNQQSIRDYLAGFAQVIDSFTEESESRRM